MKDETQHMVVGKIFFEKKFYVFSSDEEAKKEVVQFFTDYDFSSAVGF
jgi:hypothetical protein